MTTVVTHIFYGLFVTTSSLYYIASEAFKKVQGPLLAIQLILLRQSSSNVQTVTRDCQTHAIVATLPLEIWNLIKIELIGLEVLQSERDLIRENLCEHCKAECCCGSDSYANDLCIPGSWKEVPPKFCEVCDEKFVDNGPFNRELGRLDVSIYTYQHRFLLTLILQDLGKILSYYHLEIIPINIDDDGRWDYDPLSAIGIIAQQQECQSYEEYTPFHAINSLSPTTFDLPFSADYISRQFKALLNDYSVEIGDPKVSLI